MTQNWRVVRSFPALSDSYQHKKKAAICGG
jgi:hypothetical protein